MDLRVFYRRQAEEKPRIGFSLLEMMAATALVASTLVPALSLIRDAMAQSREMNRRNLLANYAVRILEEQTALAATNWTNATVTGDFSSDGYTSLRYTATKSDAVVDGGLVDRLMHIRVTVYDDADGNSSVGTNELQINFRTKVAKLVTYENEAN